MRQHQGRTFNQVLPTLWNVRIFCLAPLASLHSLCFSKISTISAIFFWLKNLSQISVLKSTFHFLPDNTFLQPESIWKRQEHSVSGNVWRRVFVWEEFNESWRELIARFQEAFAQLADLICSRHAVRTQAGTHQTGQLEQNRSDPDLRTCALSTTTYKQTDSMKTLNLTLFGLQDTLSMISINIF